MRQLWLVLLLVAAWLLPVQAQEPSQETFLKANEAYSQGRFAEAAELYRGLVSQGVKDPDLYYNLGNAYFELDDFGRARASYEKARLLAPRDPDLAHNLALLKTRLRDSEPAPGALVRLAVVFTDNELAVTAALFYFLAAGLALVYARRRDESLLWAAVAAMILLLVAGGLLGLKKWGQPGAPGVVLPATVHLKNGPGREFTDSIALHSGTRVGVTDERGDWREVAALERVKGWVRSEQLEMLAD